jgi:hypothetical protein
MAGVSSKMATNRIAPPQLESPYAERRTGAFAVRPLEWLANDLLVLTMRANPKPDEPHRAFDSDGSVSHADARRPKATYLL